MNSLIAGFLPDSKSKIIFKKLMECLDVDNLEPHAFVDISMERFNKDFGDNDRSVHGKVFEFVIGEVLAQNGIGPLYCQAQLHHVPLANFDWLLYHPVSPVSVSCKTKARERWKQAAYEALALKRVYPQSINYLVTIEKVSKTASKIKEAPQTLDHFVIATDTSFTDAVKKISQINFEEALAVSPIIRGSLIPIRGEKS